VTVIVSEVRGRTGTARFVDVPFALFGRADTLWVPPLRLAVRDALDQRKNPFYAEASRALFVATRDGATVGRVAAIENRWHNRHHGDRIGFFGFFDCEDAPDTARALFEAAEAWLRRRGLFAARGPVNPSMNHEAGLLVDGFDTPPAIMTPWNPPYYDSLVTGAGYRQVQDLLGYEIPTKGRLAVPDRVRRLAERTAKRTGVLFRPLDKNNLESEARKGLELYCEAWAGNWGFVPPSWEEFWHTAKELKTVLIPDFSFAAEVDGEMVGIMMTAVDVNRVLRDIPSGRLWPWNIAKLLVRLPKVERGRIVLLGLRDEYRHRGLFPLFAYETARRAHELDFSGGGEASWILDDNEALVAPMEAMGFEAYKRWRLYEKSLE